jgi:mono/diheme cytochrome c family protein
MPISVTATLGVLFLVLAFVSTYLMFRFWGYPYDKERRKSECPQWKMNIHRAVGYSYAAIYVVMMTQMVPRLWEYQVEFPARTVAHIMLGFTIGVILILKISILRWFRHFEEWMPFLGVGLLLCTVLLSGLSLPFVVREQAVARNDQTFSPENRQRVRALLATAGLPPATDLDALSSPSHLRFGRKVLLEECTFCHDLRTAISRPRTPHDWVRTVERMAEKPTLGPRIADQEAHAVAAYLIAVTPELQRSAKAKRAEEMEKEEAVQAAEEADGDGEEAEGDEVASAGEGKEGQPGDGKETTGTVAAAPPRARPKRPPPDPAAAKKAFETTCARCHGLSDVDDSPPRTAAQVRSLIKRMAENGMEASRRDIELIRFHLLRTYVEKP